MTDLFRRRPPVVTPADVPPDLGGDVVLTFNPSVVELDDGWLMAYRCDHGVEGDPHITGHSIAFARSSDGVTWLHGVVPPIDRSRALELLAPMEPHRDPELEFWHVYDPRLQIVPSAPWPLLMTLAVDTTCGLRPALLGSRDGGRTWYAVHLDGPDNRNVVVFPETIDSDIVRLERPANEYGGPVMGGGRYSIWIRRSADLQHWSAPRLVLRADELGETVAKIGPGAPPVRTEHGWLTIFHAVEEGAEGSGRGWEADWTKRYAAHALLLDLDDPSRVIGWSSAPVLAPIADHERLGYRNDVVFPGAAFIRAGDWDDPGGVPTLWLYYGAADSVVGLAAAPLADVLAAVDTTPDGARPAIDGG